ncbi:MAG TPA: polymer-forming cytoskeletal protein [Rhizomicrobium sp.]|jgi:cytoskeletal protein CcmA (bactofilin family)
MSMFNRNEKDTVTGSAVGEKPAETPAPVAAVPKPVQPVLQPAPEPVAPVRSGNAGPSVISKALKITGQLESTEDIRIDGEVEGDIHGVSVTVGNGAKVKGSVYGQTVELAGTIEGKIEAKKVILTSTAHMAGDVIHQDIKIESGAYIDGHCRPGTNKLDGKPAGKPN